MRTALTWSLELTLMAAGVLAEPGRTPVQIEDLQPLHVETGLTEGPSEMQPERPEGVDPDWWRTVQEEIAQSEYHIRWQEGVGAYQSPNRAQNLRFTYRGDGFSAEPRTYHEEDLPWKLGMSLTFFALAVLPYRENAYLVLVVVLYEVFVAFRENKNSGRLLPFLVITAVAFCVAWTGRFGD